MERIRGYKEAVDVIEATANRVAEEIVNREVTDKHFLMAQLDKFMSITYLLRFNIEKMMDEAECDCSDSSGELGLLLLDLMSQERTDRRNA